MAIGTLGASLWSLLLLAVLLGNTAAQVPIPTRPDGFVYKQGSAEAPLQLEAHLDLLCPDCKAAFPVLLQVADHYGARRLRLLLHGFPLPYHRNAFLAAQAGTALSASGGPEAWYQWAAAVFEAQARFSGSATANLTLPQTVAAFGQLAKQSGLSEAVVVKGLTADPEADSATRIGWKFGCSRGVTGTPTFFVNGVVVSADSTWDLQAWTQLLDPLLPATAKDTPTPRDGQQRGGEPCPDGTALCEFLPGQTQCCPPTEACIPNVGCRCLESVSL